MKDKQRFDPIALYHSAIMNADGTVNAGYVFLFRTMRIYGVLLVIVTAAAGAIFYAAWELDKDARRVDELAKVLTAYGTVVGTISAAIFVTVLPGIAAFIWSDSHTQSVPAGGVAPAGVLPTIPADVPLKTAPPPPVQRVQQQAPAQQQQPPDEVSQYHAS